ncbi:poly-gamma-glutamate biosynthesis protein [Plebeiibacterium sediminum]|uniref:Poly-gamma-glutamate biosynthesis protein n=1 Tax=Plebeiibacterium sediminum TaxID=2992112 RepID=A0AAE3M3X7_9BACT|nr:poly-gamma-glutamate biosynthesis protein [Plebeiobacterium sediminum]MCW3786649.1 poly-gamma-glutamate biosynthesis protein [Plebeiobacterium sediminum]
MSVITTKKELSSVLKHEKQMYYDYMFQTRSRLFMGWLKHEPIYLILKWQKASRIADYYLYASHHGGNILDKLLYLFYIRKRNIKANRLGIEITTTNIAPGFLLYHFGATVINGGTMIGKNCRMHGNNCIGNSGPQNPECPVIGDNVMIGVGAKIIGNINIANNIKIAAGAVVVNSVYEEGITIGGIPAKQIK